MATSLDKPAETQASTSLHPRALWDSLVDWALHTEGSSRSSALIRIGLVYVVWARWGGEVTPFRDLSTEGILLSVNFWAASTLMLLGVFTRLSTAWMATVALTMYYYFGYELGVAEWTHHHSYLLAFGVLLSALTPAGKSYSVDRWLAVRRARQQGRPLPAERGNLFGLRLIAIQLSVVYFFSAFDKTTLVFLSGARLEHLMMWYYIGSDYAAISGYRMLIMLVAWATVALEYSLAFGMLFPQTRKWLVIPGSLLHAGFYVLLPIQTFSATVMVLYLAYLNADKVHAFIDQIQGHTPEADETVSAPAVVE